MKKKIIYIDIMHKQLNKFQQAAWFNRYNLFMIQVPLSSFDTWTTLKE